METSTLIFSGLLLLILSQPVATIVNGIGTYQKVRNRYGHVIKFCPTQFAWTLFCLLLIIQYCLAMYESTVSKAVLTPFEMFIHLINVLNMATMARIAVPEFNSPDVWDKIKSGEKYTLQEYYRLHCRSLAIHGFVLLATVIVNYGLMNGSYKNYITDRLGYHVIFAIVLALMLFVKPKGEGDEDRFHTWIHRGIAFTSLATIVTIIFCG